MTEVPVTIYFALEDVVVMVLAGMLAGWCMRCLLPDRVHERRGEHVPASPVAGPADTTAVAYRGGDPDSMDDT